MASRLTDNAKKLLHLVQRALKGIPADIPEPEGPFFDNEEIALYDLLRNVSAVQVVAPLPVPTITGFLPLTGAAGSTVVITGTHLTGATLVSVSSGAVAGFNVDSDTQITAVISSSQVTGKLRITTPIGTATSASNFIVQGQAAGNQLSLVPSGGMVASGITTTIKTATPSQYAANNFTYSRFGIGLDGGSFEWVVFNPTTDSVVGLATAADIVTAQTAAQSISGVRYGGHTLYTGNLLKAGNGAIDVEASATTFTTGTVFKLVVPAKSTNGTIKLYAGDTLVYDYGVTISEPLFPMVCIYHTDGIVNSMFLKADNAPEYGNSGTPTNYRVTSKDVAVLAYEKVQAIGNVWGPYSQIFGETNSDTLTLSLKSTFLNYSDAWGYGGVQMRVNGGAWTYYDVPQSSGNNEYTTPAINLPGAAGSKRTIQIRTGYTEGQGNFTAGDFQGVIVTGINTPTGITITKPARKPNCIVIIADSLHGNRATPPHLLSWVAQLMDDPSFADTDFVVIAWGKNCAWYSFADTTCLNIYKSQLDEAFGGRTGTCRLIERLGANDETLFGVTPDQTARGIGYLVDYEHSQRPATIIDVHTILHQEKNNTNDAGFLTSMTTGLRTYTDPADGLTKTRNWLNIYDNSQVVGTADLSPLDMIHLLTPGHGKVYTFQKSTIAGTTPPMF